MITLCPFHWQASQLVCKTGNSKGCFAIVVRVQAFQRFLGVSDVSGEVAASRIREANVTEAVRTLLEEFLLPRRMIIEGLAGYSTALGEMRAEGSPGNLRMPRRVQEGGQSSSAPSVSWPVGRSLGSPLMQLLQLHSRLRLQLRPQQRAPSLEQWMRQQQQREIQRRGQRKSQPVLLSPDDEVTGVST